MPCLVEERHGIVAAMDIVGCNDRTAPRRRVMAGGGRVVSLCAGLVALASVAGSCREPKAAKEPLSPPTRYARDVPAKCDGSFPLARRWGIAGEEQNANVAGPIRVGPDGTLYFGLGPSVRAATPDGRIKWSFKAPSVVSSRPIVKGDSLFATDGYRSVFLLDATTGTEKWVRGLGGWNYGSPGVGPDGLLLEGSWDGTMYAFKPSGEVLWGYLTEAWVFSAPLTVGSNVYFGSGDGGLYALDAAGKLRWRYLTAGDVNASPVEGPNGEILVGSYDGRLHALAPNGELLWTRNVGAEVAAAVLVAGDRIYVPALDGSVSALTLDGAPVWRWVAVGGITAPPVSTRRGRIAVVTDRGETCLLEQSGAPVACVVQTSAAANTGVAIGIGGEILVSGEAGLKDEELVTAFEECP